MIFLERNITGMEFFNIEDVKPLEKKELLIMRLRINSHEELEKFIFIAEIREKKWYVKSFDGKKHNYNYIDIGPNDYWSKIPDLPESSHGKEYLIIKE